MPSSLNSMLEALEDSTFDELIHHIESTIGRQKNVSSDAINASLTGYVKFVKDKADRALLCDFLSKNNITLLSNGNNMVLRVISTKPDKKADDFSEVITLEMKFSSLKNKGELSEETKENLEASGVIALPSYERKIKNSQKVNSLPSKYSKISIAPFQAKGSITDSLLNHTWKNKKPYSIDAPVMKALYCDFKHAIKIYRTLTENHVLLPDGKYANLMKDAPMRDIKSLIQLDSQNKYTRKTTKALVTPGYVPPEFDSSPQLRKHQSVNLEAAHAYQLGRNMFLSLTGIEPPCHNNIYVLGPLYERSCFDQMIENLHKSTKIFDIPEDRPLNIPFSAINPIPGCFTTNAKKELWTLMVDLTEQRPEARISLANAEQKLDTIFEKFYPKMKAELDKQIAQQEIRQQQQHQEWQQQKEAKKWNKGFEALTEQVNKIVPSIEKLAPIVKADDSSKKNKDTSSLQKAKIRKYEKLQTLHHKLSTILEKGKTNKTPISEIASKMKEIFTEDFNGNYQALAATSKLGMASSIFSKETGSTKAVKEIVEYCDKLAPNHQPTQKM